MHWRKPLLLALFLIGSAGASTAATATDWYEKAVTMLVKQNNAATFPAESFFQCKIPQTQFGAYHLLCVSNANALPSPRWIFAYRDEKNSPLLRLDSNNVDAWNHLVTTAKLQLLDKQSMALFPVTFLKIVAPDEKPRWRFNTGDSQRLTAEGAALLKKGWSSKAAKNGKEIAIHFISENLIGDLYSWEMLINQDGQMQKLSRSIIE